ncbi:MAG: hypothetical protein JW885_02785 [Deltaproteobacteria bacterium]|nr:hypothetical protein [Candidatus Zymogenaceae bacterium]
MARYDEKADIILLDQKVTQPVGDNRVRVEDDDRGVISDGRPQITLFSNRSNLDSNGVDATRVWAECRYASGDRISPTSRRETVTPYWPVNEITVSAWILEDPGTPPRVYVKIGDDELGDEIPVAFWEGRKITTAVDMEYVEHIVVYEGTETVSFSVDQLADIAPTEVPVVNGVAETTLTAQASGGGLATVTGNLMGVDDDLVITINDATVGAITAEANPGNIDMNETSQIIARVTGPDDLPVPDGKNVYFSFYPGADVIGVLSAASAQTQTDTIENEENWSANDITVNTYYPITELISVRTTKDESGYNFADGATVDGNTIILDEPLWALGDDGEQVALSKMLCYVTYATGGIATVEFDPSKQGEAVVVCRAGQESCVCSVVVGTDGTGVKGTSAGGGSGSDDEGAEAGLGEWRETLIGPGEFTWTPTEKKRVISNLLQKPNDGEELEYEIVKSDHLSIRVDPISGMYYATVYGKTIVTGETQYGIAEPFGGKILVQKKVEGEGETTFPPLPGCSVIIAWEQWGEMPGWKDDPDAVEICPKTDTDGITRFTNGRVGTHEVLVTDRDGTQYEPQSISISEYDVLTGEIPLAQKFYVAKARASYLDYDIQGVPVTYHGIIRWRIKREGALF